jgi:hypothetical protein
VRAGTSPKARLLAGGPLVVSDRRHAPAERALPAGITSRDELRALARQPCSTSPEVPAKREHRDQDADCGPPDPREQRSPSPAHLPRAASGAPARGWTRVTQDVGGRYACVRPRFPAPPDTRVHRPSGLSGGLSVGGCPPGGRRTGRTRSAAPRCGLRSGCAPDGAGSAGWRGDRWGAAGAAAPGAADRSA